MSARVLVDRYMAELELAARFLPPQRAAELADEVREHITTALGAPGFDDEASVRNVLGRLGAPAEIVSAEEGGDVDPRSAAAGPSMLSTRQGPAAVLRRLVIAGLIGVLALLLVGLVLSQGPGALAFAIGAAAVSPVVWLALIAVGASRRGAGSGGAGPAARAIGARRRPSPALVGLVAALVVLACLAVVAGPMLFGAVAVLMIPVLVLLLVVEVLRGR
jgi:hypothetical protein